MPFSLPNPDKTGNAPAAPTPANQATLDTRIHVTSSTGQHAVDGEDLLDEDSRTEFTEFCNASSTPAIVDIENILNLNAEARWFLLQLIRDTEASCQVGNEAPTNMFDAVLQTMVGPDDIDSCGAGREAALEAAVLLHRNDLDLACNRILQRLRDLGVAGMRIDDLHQKAKAVLGSLTIDPEEQDVENVLVLYALPGAPVPEDAVVPSGWDISPDGIRRDSGNSDSDEELCIATPLVVSGRLSNFDHETEILVVSWFRDERWVHRLVDRRVLADARKIIELSEFGLPVNSNNAKDVVQFVADFEQENLECIPRASVSSHLGWQGDPPRGFLCGSSFVASQGDDDSDSMPVDLTKQAPTDWGENTILFQVADDGDNQVAAGFTSIGTFDGWREAIRPVERFPRVIFGLVAALAPPLLRIVGCDNSVVSFSGSTSTGKTSTLRGAGSVWGCPDDNVPASVLSTWDATRVYREISMCIQGDLPLLLDDTKRAKSPEEVSQTIYDVASGRSRGRGSKKGLRASGASRCILLMTGESPAVSFSKDGGTRARTLEIWGSPFGEADGGTAKLINKFNDGIRQNYGHAGPRFVRYLLDHQDEWSAWRDRCHQYRSCYEQRSTGNAIAYRLASPLALIRLAAELASEADVLPWNMTDPVEPLWDDLMAETAQADQAIAALRFTNGWAIAHSAEFWGRHHGVHDSARPPSAGWAGQWDTNGLHIGFMPHRLQEILTRERYDADAILRTWADRGWLKTTSDGSGRKPRPKVRGKIKSDRPWLVGILQTAIDEHCGECDSNVSEHERPRRSSEARRIAKPARKQPATEVTGIPKPKSRKSNRRKRVARPSKEKPWDDRKAKPTTQTARREGKDGRHNNA